MIELRAGDDRGLRAVDGEGRVFAVQQFALPVKE
jgi:hypothetical protein